MEKSGRKKDYPDIYRKSLTLLAAAAEAQDMPHSTASWLETLLHNHWEEKHDGKNNRFYVPNNRPVSALNVFSAAAFAVRTMSTLTNIPAILESPLWQQSERSRNFKQYFDIGIGVLRQCSTCGPLMQRLDTQKEIRGR